VPLRSGRANCANQSGGTIRRSGPCAHVPEIEASTQASASNRKILFKARVRGVAHQSCTPPDWGRSAFVVSAALQPPSFGTSLRTLMGVVFGWVEGAADGRTQPFVGARQSGPRSSSSRLACRAR